MASYLDMVMVLMCLFIVMYSMSTIDQHKYEQLRESLATGFGIVLDETPDPSPGVATPDPSARPETPEPPSLAGIEKRLLTELSERLGGALASRGLRHTVSFELDERGLTVRLLGSETFFESNSTRLSATAEDVLDAIGPVLAESGHEVSVEGHADYRSSGYPFPTNWELSSGRATQVLRHLVERTGMPPEKIGAVGYGSARPIAKGTSPDELALNRRVDVVVISEVPLEL